MPTKRPTIFLQAACSKHRYIRSRDLSAIVERPERLRAVALGLAAAVARLESVPDADLDSLAGALDRLSIAAPCPSTNPSPVLVVHSTASVDLLHDPAVRFVHGDAYPAQLSQWARDSRDAIARGASEIPDGLPQGDLYLCPESMDAMQGAVGAVCEAVDSVVASASDRRAFVAVRPPGHHCGDDTPSGFCFVNNVAIAAAHAHLKHGVNRVVILDIDLHHGNGTQAIVWRINEETHRLNLEAAAGAPSRAAGLQMYYGSTHDVLSYPCEDGAAQHIAAASLSIHAAHGQHIENVHLQPYTTPAHFWDVLYAGEYTRILRRAAEFLDRTGGPGDDVLVFISCGMDASEHEHASMSRHARTVPTAFFHRFARDACALADTYARGRLVSVLEGGYSDRALVSGSMAHLSGLVDAHRDGDGAQEGWWDVRNLVVLEKAMKRLRRRRRRHAQQEQEQEEEEQGQEPWVRRTLEIFASLDGSTKTSASAAASALVGVPPSMSMTMTLRARKTGRSVSASASAVVRESRSGSSSGSGNSSGSEGAGGDTDGGKNTDKNADPNADAGKDKDADTDKYKNKKDNDGSGPPKKLPRVILRLGPHPSRS